MQASTWLSALPCRNWGWLSDTGVDTLATTIAITSFVSDPGGACLLLAPVELWPANLLASTKGKILNRSQFLFDSLGNEDGMLTKTKLSKNALKGQLTGTERSPWLS